VKEYRTISNEMTPLKEKLKDIEDLKETLEDDPYKFYLANKNLLENQEILVNSLKTNGVPVPTINDISNEWVALEYLRQENLDLIQQNEEMTKELDDCIADLSLYTKKVFRQI
jgi:RIO-like serine/threonine protein kinase